MHQRSDIEGEEAAVLVEGVAFLFEQCPGLDQDGGQIVRDPFVRERRIPNEGAR